MRISDWISDVCSSDLTGRGFGGRRRPLFVSVRSGAPVSMPGMMETILNIGLGEATLHGFLRMTGNPRQVQDCYRRLIRDYTEVVSGVDAAPFDALAEKYAAEEGLAHLRDQIGRASCRERVCQYG